MGKRVKRKSDSKSSSASVAAPPVAFEGTAEEHVAYLQRKVISLQELVDYKSNKIQKVRKRDIQLDKLSEKHEKQIEDLEQEHETQFKNLEERHEREIDKLSSRHEQELDELESRQEREAEQLENKFDIFSDADTDEEEENNDEKGKIKR